MIQLKHSISNLSDISFYEDFIFTRDRDNVLYCSKAETMQLVWKKEVLKGLRRISKVFFHNGHYYIPHSKGVIKIGIKSGESTNINFGEFEFIASNSESPKKLFFDYSNSIYKLYDFATESVSWEISSKNIPCLVYFIFRDRFVCYQKSVITNLSLNNGEIKWQIDLNSENWDHDFLVESIGILTEVNGRLYLGINNKYIFVVDMWTGEKLKTISTLPEEKTWNWFNKTYDYLSFIGSALHLEEKNVIASLAFSYYWEINLQNDAITFWDFTDTFSAIPLRAATDDHWPSWSIHSKGKLYFLSIIDDKEAKTRDARIACFDLDNKEVIDTYQFDIDQNVELLKSSMSIHKNWLKISESSGTTYIFELDGINLTHNKVTINES